MGYLIRLEDVDTKALVLGETERVRERVSGELVHLRKKDERNTICTACGGFANVWVSSPDKWELHPMRCTDEDILSTEENGDEL